MSALEQKADMNLAQKSHFEGPLSVESRCGAVAVGSVLSVAAPFVRRCPSNRTITPFPHPAHRTGHADFPHPALGQDTYFRTRKVIRSSPTHRTELCDSSGHRIGVPQITTNTTAWVVIRFPDRSPVLSSLQYVALSAAPAH